MTIPEIMQNFQATPAPVPSLESIIRNKQAEVSRTYAKTRELIAKGRQRIPNHCKSIKHALMSSHGAEKAALAMLTYTVTRDYENLVAAYSIKDKREFLLANGVPDEFEDILAANQSISEFSRKLGLDVQD